MKFSIFVNDKSTAKDEFILFLIILVFLAGGISLVLLKPSFWIIDAADTAVFGVLMVLTGMMFIPGLIYRLMTNDKGQG